MSRLVYDAEVTMLLQSNLIENEPSLEALRDAMEAWDYLAPQPSLDDEIVCRTHEILMQSRDLSEKYKGFYRRIPVYIGGAAKLNFGVIPVEMREWLAKMNEPVTAMGHEPAAAQVADAFRARKALALHVEYENIHPFVDGNGRTGRMFYNWHRLQLGLPVHVINSDPASRREYYGWFQ